MVTKLQLQAQAILELRRRGILPDFVWPERYVSSISGQEYFPQSEDVNEFICNDNPRYMLLKGGEGGGKSAAGVIKNLNRLKRGMSGIMVSTDLQHFKKSIWPTFREWCPWHCVVPSQRRRQYPSWEPAKSFTMVFKNDLGGYSELVCGGAEETNLKTWEGPNTSFIHFDEARGHKTPNALKIFDGRIRIRGSGNEPPQMYLTTTPRKHWLFEYFAGSQGDEESQSLVPDEVMQKYADFKRDARVFTVLTSENPAIDSDFVRQRAQTLTESEQRVLLQALWEDLGDIEKFVNIIWWDNCRENTAPIGRDEPAIIALDAATGSENPGYMADCFAVIMVTRHPDRPADVMVRYCGIWQATPGELLNFQPIEEEIRRLCRDFSVIEVAYDPHQLHDMATRLKTAHIANFKPFGQGKDRQLADKQLQDVIMARRIAHDGNPALRQHIDNADVKKYGVGEGIRLVKRSTSQKIDASVATSMAVSRCLYYNLG
jgi:hypothetical protein